MAHILVLVSDEKVRELRKLVLTSAGFQVEAPELSAAGKMIESSEFDALVLSRLEPEKACELIADYRRRNPRGQVVAIGPAAQVRRLADAAVEPYDPGGLVRTLQSCVGDGAK